MKQTDLLEPSKLYRLHLKDEHHERVEKFFDELAKKSGVDISANQATCKKLYSKQAEKEALEKKLSNLGWLAFLFGILCLVIIGIFLLIFVYKPKKKNIQELLAKIEPEIKKLTAEAWAQMAPLNALFNDDIPSKLFQQTVPLIEMDRNFDRTKYEMLVKKYGMWGSSPKNRSVLNLQTGSILGNPFVFFKDKVMTMMPHTYVGTKVITYTRRIYTKDGSYTVTETQTLRATVTKPKPEYSEDTYLVYGNEAAPHLTFSRGPSPMRGMDEKQREKYVHKNEDNLRKIAEKEMGKGGTYTPLGNSLFELSFGGLNRNNEVEFRLLFTPLAQKAMIDLLFSDEGFGDDFYMKKDKCINIVESGHMRGESIFLESRHFQGFDFEKIRADFIDYNDFYFKAIYFDFAPLLSIPLYQQYKPKEYIYKNTVKSQITPFEHEMLVNLLNPEGFADKSSITDIIYRTNYNGEMNGADQVHVVAESFRGENHVELVPVMGGDGRLHNVPVPWVEYIGVSGEGDIQTANIGGNEIAFRSVGNQNTIYRRGLIALQSGLNVDIKSLKSQMAKEEN